MRGSKNMANKNREIDVGIIFDDNSGILLVVLLFIIILLFFIKA